MNLNCGFILISVQETQEPFGADMCGLVYFHATRVVDKYIYSLLGVPRDPYVYNDLWTTPRNDHNC